MKLTLLQIMKVVVACALAMAYVTPLIRLAEAEMATWSAMLTVGAISVPLVFATTTIVLARKGPVKTLMVLVLMMSSLMVVISLSGMAFSQAANTWLRRGLPVDLTALGPLLVFGLPTLLLGSLFFYLLRKVVLTLKIQGADRAAQVDLDASMT